MPKVFNIFFILAPILVWLLLSVFNVSFAWLYCPDYVIYNLIFSSALFIIFIIGVTNLLKKPNYHLVIIFSLVFIGYQLFSWSFRGVNFVDKLVLSEQQSLVLAHQGRGAIGDDYLQVILVKKVNPVLITTTILHSFDYSAKGQFGPYSTENNTVSIHYKTYAKGSTQAGMKTYDLILNKTK